MNDVDIKNKRILLFDFDGTLIETASGNTFATDLTDMRIKICYRKQSRRSRSWVCFWS